MEQNVGKIQWFCPQGPWEDTPNFPKTPQRKEILHKLLAKHPGYLPGVCGWDLRKNCFRGVRAYVNIGYGYLPSSAMTMIIFVSKRSYVRVPACLCHATATSKEKKISWDLWEFEILVASYMFIQIPIWIIRILFSTRSRIQKKIPNINRKTNSTPPPKKKNSAPIQEISSDVFFWFSITPPAWWNRNRRRRAWNWELQKVHRRVASRISGGENLEVFPPRDRLKRQPGFFWERKGKPKNSLEKISGQFKEVVTWRFLPTSNSNSEQVKKSAHPIFFFEKTG